MTSKASDRPSNRFLQTNRLNSSAAFDSVFASKHRWADRIFIVIAVRNDSPIARLGLSISKKHFKRATQRNRIKRIIRDSFRCSKAFLSGLDIVVLSRNSLDNLSNAAIALSLKRHWTSIGKWRLN